MRPQSFLGPLVLLLTAGGVAQDQPPVSAVQEALAGRESEETRLLGALQDADSPGSKEYVRAAFTLVRFYMQKGSLLKAKETLERVEQRQLRDGVGVEDISPFLERLADVEAHLLLWPEQAETLGRLIRLWSASPEGPRSTVVAHFALQQAVAFKAQGRLQDAAAALKQAAGAMCAVSGPWQGIDLAPVIKTYDLTAIALSEHDLSCPGSVYPGAYKTSAAPARAFRVGPGVTASKLLSRVDPVYSSKARQALLEGTVVLRIVVRATGSAGEFWLMEPLGLGLDERAVEAVRQWKFAPGEKDGKPVATFAAVEVNFHLI